MISYTILYSAKILKISNLKSILQNNFFQKNYVILILCCKSNVTKIKISKIFSLFLHISLLHFEKKTFI